jgi:hypothetical protein
MGTGFVRPLFRPMPAVLGLPVICGVSRAPQCQAPNSNFEDKDREFGYDRAYRKASLDSYKGQGIS